ncbi:UNVERIFIED_CONTAM: hypothetical protein GTU68_043440, partial [Idotea baltica]|nr:hypothetical protein [Idotea baltica]
QNILLVEDDVELASLVRDYLSKNSFDVTVVDNGIDAVETARSGVFDLLILDVMLPGLSGMEVCREVRADYHGPILMLTALDDDMDQMLGLELGADDYIIKPVQPRLLLARIRSLLRRINVDGEAPTVSAQKQSTQIIKVGLLTINLNNRTTQVAGEEVELSSAELELLLLLAQDAGSVVTRELIVQDLRGFEYDGLDRSIDRRISRLRKKLQDHSGGIEMIKTIRGKGYQLCTNN